MKNIDQISKVVAETMTPVVKTLIEAHLKEMRLITLMPLSGLMDLPDNAGRDYVGLFIVSPPLHAKLRQWLAETEPALAEVLDAQWKKLACTHGNVNETHCIDCGVRV